VLITLLQWNAIYFTVLATSVHNDCCSVYIPCVTEWQLLLQEAHLWKDIGYLRIYTGVQRVTR